MIDSCPSVAVIRSVLRSLRLTRHSCRWLGVPVYTIPRRVRETIDDEIIRDYVRQRLTELLYEQFYCPGRPTAIESRAGGLSIYGDPAFVQALSDANHGGGSRESGWLVRHECDERVVIENGAFHLDATPAQLRPEDAGPLRPGTSVSIAVPKGLSGRSPGFYMAVSDSEWRDEDSALRVYWNVEPRGAVRVMDALTRSLNARRLAFRFKCLLDPLAYRRCDSAILYLRRDDWLEARSGVADAHARSSAYMNSMVPPFTKPLAHGLALAEDPSSGESFGFHRCRLISDGLARGIPWPSVESALEAIVERFAQERIDLRAPYLNPGATDDGMLTLEKNARLRRIRSVGVRERVEQSWLEAAAQIGRRICDDALWDSDRCAWMSYVNPDEAIRNATPSLSSLGPALYHGSAGIALFLAMLYAQTHDHQIRKTVIGAMKHSLSRSGSIDRRHASGLFDGALGIAVAAAMTGVLIADEELLSAARSLTRSILASREDESRNEHDLFSGRAGMIMALLILEGMDAGEALLAVALEVGEALVAAGMRSGHSLSWSSPSSPADRHLLGFSHGTAGIACALLELWRRTGRREFKGAAEEAFAYERGWFDVEHQNWPDFRVDNEKRGAERRRPRFISVWCHGAPGIALSRCRAAEVLGDHVWTAEARVAIGTTKSSILNGLEDPHAELCLCHGLAGNADILLCSRFLESDSEAKSSRQLAERVGRRLIKSGIATVPRFSRCGHSAGDTPSLMLGLAGVGWYFLRLHDETVPSILDVRGWGRETLAPGQGKMAPKDMLHEAVRATPS